MAQQSEMDGNKGKKSSNNSVNVGAKVVLPPEISNDQVTQKTSTFCRWCLSPIAEKAIICPTCKGHQKLIWNYFSQIFSVVSVLISIVLVFISAAHVYLTKSTLNVAREEKIKATEALDIAQSALKEALKLKAVISEAQFVVNDLSLIADANTAAVGAIYNIHELRKLWNMSRDTNEKIRVIAEKLLKPIIDQLRTDHEMVNSDYWGFRDIEDPQYYGFNEMEGWKRSEYIKNYKRVPDDRRVVYVIQFLRDEKETEEEKLSFCDSALQLESRPDVIYELCAFIDERAKLQKDYLFETDYYLIWLKERNAQPQL